MELKMAKKKIKNKNTQLLLYDFSNLDVAQTREVTLILKKKLLHEAKFIVGYDNYISIKDLFCKIYGLDYDAVEFYKRICWLEVLRKCMRKLRSDMTAYFIVTKNKVFILKTSAEASVYKKFLQRDIESLKRAQHNADAWVSREMWKNLGSFSNSNKEDKNENKRADN